MTSAALAFPLPAGPITQVKGRALVLRGDDIDTDRIIPARFLKCVTFEGLGQQVFADDRIELQGAHPFDQPGHQGARLLLVNRNFGCGSSREHAPQALMRWGIRAVVGESFAEIFYGNCLALGIPCLTASHELLLAIQAVAAADPAAELELEVATARLRSSQPEVSWELDLPAGPRQMLSTGQWDGTGQLVGNSEALAATAARLPYMTNFAG
jgi:3-isopropylmalate/(R)-2-methylmalate dehydratase small subunit